MAAGYVPNGAVTPLYENTTPGTVASPVAVDGAVVAMVQTINDNWQAFYDFIIGPIIGVPDGAVTTPKIRDLAITTQKIAELAVVNSKIADGTISTQKLADAIITTLKLADASVTNSKLAELSVTVSKIADGTISTQKLMDELITTAKLGNGSVTEAKLSNGSVSTRALADRSVTAGKLDPSLVYPISDAGIQYKFGLVNEQLEDIAINVRSYGAVGNGSANDTVAINSAINYLASVGGGTLLFPNGIFMIDTTTDSNNSIGGIALIDNINVVLSPDTIIRAIPNSAGRYNVISIWNKKNITITGGTIQGDRAGHTGSTGEWGYGISCKGSQNVVIKNMIFNDCWGDGLIIGGSSTQPSKNVYMEQCISSNNRRQGLTIAWVDGVTVVNCDFCYTSGTAPQAGLDIEPDNGHVADKVIISYCRFYNNAGSGFLSAGVGTTEDDSRVKGVKLIGNYSYNNGINGFHFTNSFNCTSAQNTAYSNAAIGILAGGGGGHIFSDSYSYSNTTDGLRLSNTVKKSVINGGQIEKSGQFGVSLVTSSGNSVTGLSVNNNGYHGISVLSASHSNDISSNTCEGNGTATADTYSNIKVYSNSDYNNVQNNNVRVGANTNKPKYGIEIADTTSDRNFVSNNNCRLSGNVGGIFNSGTSTNFGAGNFNNDGTFGTTPN